MFFAVMGAISIASAAMSAKAGSDAKKAAGKAADAAAYQGARDQARSTVEGEQAEQNSLDKAQDIKGQAVVTQGRQMAAFAANGVMVGNGSARAMMDETKRLAEQDALIAMMDGAKAKVSAGVAGTDAVERAGARSRSLLAQGQSAQTQGYASALGSLSSATNSFRQM